jgi:hypothetical protein
MIEQHTKAEKVIGTATGPLDRGRAVSSPRRLQTPCQIYFTERSLTGKQNRRTSLFLRIQLNTSCHFEREPLLPFNR